MASLCVKREKIVEMLKTGEKLSEISRQLLHTTSTAPLNNLMEKYKIDPSQYNDNYLYMNKEWLEEKLKECGTPWGVTKKYGMPRTSVTRYAERFGLYERSFTRDKVNAINEDYFKEIDSADKAYYLGLIMTDGSIYHFKDSNEVQFELKLQRSDEEILEQMAADLSFPVDKLKRGVGERNGVKHPYTTLRSYNVVFCENLMKHGIVDRKTGRESFREEIPEEYKRDFVRGLWDGDGSVSIKRGQAITFSSVTKDLVLDMSAWLEENNISHSVLTSMRTTYTMYTINIFSKSKIDFVNLIYYGGCKALKRKRFNARALAVHYCRQKAS